MVDLRYIEVELGKVKERLLVPGASWCPGGVLKARPGPDLRRRCVLPGPCHRITGPAVAPPSGHTVFSGKPADCVGNDGRERGIPFPLSLTCMSKRDIERGKLYFGHCSS